MYGGGDVEGEVVKKGNISNLVGDLSERRLEHRKEALGWPALYHRYSNNSSFLSV